MSEELTVEKKQEMKEQLKEQAKKPSVFSRCKLIEVDGHIEATCQSKEASHALAELLEQEVVIRVKADKVTEEPEHEFTTVEELEQK